MEEKLTKVNYFTNFDLAKFINAINVNTYLQRYREKHLIFRIKQGIYVSTERLEYFEKVGKKTEYLYFLATNVINPMSYLSGPYILSLNNITTESAFTITLITTKKTNTIENDFGTFIYQNIHNNLFRGYERKEEFGLIYYRAYPEKALLDWLWLKKDIHYSLEFFRELRLNVELLDFKRLEDFVQKFNKPKIIKCFKFLQKLAGG